MHPKPRAHRTQRTHAAHAAPCSVIALHHILPLLCDCSDHARCDGLRAAYTSGGARARVHTASLVIARLLGGSLPGSATLRTRSSCIVARRTTKDTTRMMAPLAVTTTMDFPESTFDSCAGGATRALRMYEAASLSSASSPSLRTRRPKCRTHVPSGLHPCPNRMVPRRTSRRARAAKLLTSCSSITTKSDFRSCCTHGHGYPAPILPIRAKCRPDSGKSAEVEPCSSNIGSTCCPYRQIGARSLARGRPRPDNTAGWSL